MKKAFIFSHCMHFCNKRQVNKRKTNMLNNTYTSYVHGRYPGKLSRTSPNGLNHHLKCYLQLKVSIKCWEYRDQLWEVTRINSVRFKSGAFITDKVSCELVSSFLLLVQTPVEIALLNVNFPFRKVNSALD